METKLRACLVLVSRVSVGMNEGVIGVNNAQHRVGSNFLSTARLYTLSYALSHVAFNFHST